MARRLCPELVFVGVNYQKYSEGAQVHRNIFKQYDPNFHSIGLDEATLELSNYMKQTFKPTTQHGRCFGGDCQCRLPAWCNDFDVEHPDTIKEHVKCDKCGKNQAIYSFTVTFGIQIEDIVNEIRFRVEQETGGLTCSAGKNTTN